MQGRSCGRIDPYPRSGYRYRNAIGRLTFNLFASIAQFERENMLERQRVGIAAAKKRRAYKRRVPTARAKSDRVLALADKGLTKQEIADACSIGIASVYRILRVVPQEV